jgi:hypothetical protein
MAKKVNTVSQLVDKTRKNDVSLSQFLSKDIEDFTPSSLKWLVSKDALKKWTLAQSYVKSKIDLTGSEICTKKSLIEIIELEINQSYDDNIRLKFRENGSILVPVELREKTDQKMAKVLSYFNNNLKPSAREFYNGSFAQKLFKFDIEKQEAPKVETLEIKQDDTYLETLENVILDSSFPKGKKAKSIENLLKGLSSNIEQEVV